VEKSTTPDRSGGKFQLLTEVKLIRWPRPTKKVALCLQATGQAQHIQLQTLVL
jgi:hypothetical protein